MLNVRFLFIIFVIALTGVSQGIDTYSVNFIIPSTSTYYVSPSGNDSNPGNSSNPYATITYCLSSISAGQQCQLSSGNYSEEVIFSDGTAFTLDDGSSTLFESNRSYHKFGNISSMNVSKYSLYITPKSGNASLKVSGLDFNLDAMNTSSVFTNSTNVSYKLKVSNIQNRNMQYNFTGSYNVSFTLNTWNPSAGAGSTAVNFTTSSQDGNSITFTVGNLTASTGYTIKKDGSALTSTTSNSSGYVTITSSVWSEHTFTAEQTAQSSGSSVGGGGGGGNGASTFLAELTEKLSGSSSTPQVKIDVFDNFVEIFMKNEGKQPQEYILNWNIRDTKNAIISTGVESKKLAVQESYKKKINTADLSDGDYVIRAVVQYGIYQSESSAYFNIQEGKTSTKKQTALQVSSEIGMGIAIFGAIYFTLRYFKNRKMPPKQHLWRIQ